MILVYLIEFIQIALYVDILLTIIWALSTSSMVTQSASP